MSDSLREAVVKLPASAQNPQIDAAVDAVEKSLAEIVSLLSHSNQWDMIERLPVLLQHEVRRREIEHIRATTRKLTPEEIEEVMQDFNEEEFIAGIREIEETGGVQMKDFIEEFRQLVENEP